MKLGEPGALEPWDSGTLGPWPGVGLRTAVSLDLFAMGDLSRSVKPQGTKLVGSFALIPPPPILPPPPPPPGYSGSSNGSRKQQ